MKNFYEVLKAIKKQKLKNNNIGCGICPLRFLRDSEKDDISEIKYAEQKKLFEATKHKLGFAECYNSVCFKKYAVYACFFKEEKEIAFLKKLNNPPEFCLVLNKILDNRIRVYRNKAEIE